MCSIGGSYSGEQDYNSLELSSEYLHWMDEGKNQAISFGTSLQANEILIQECIVNDACDTQSGASETMNSNTINYYDQGDYFDATYYTLGAKYKF